MKIQLLVFLTSALRENEWSGSGSGRFTAGNQSRYPLDTRNGVQRKTADQVRSVFSYTLRFLVRCMPTTKFHQNLWNSFGDQTYGRMETLNLLITSSLCKESIETIWRTYELRKNHRKTKIRNGRKK
jgi:hypothetical protein